MSDGGREREVGEKGIERNGKRGDLRGRRREGGIERWSWRGKDGGIDGAGWRETWSWKGIDMDEEMELDGERGREEEIQRD